MEELKINEIEKVSLTKDDVLVVYVSGLNTASEKRIDDLRSVLADTFGKDIKSIILDKDNADIKVMSVDSAFVEGI